MGSNTTVGKLLLEKDVPKELHTFLNSGTLDKKNISDLFNKISERSSDVYKTSVSNLSRLGFEVATQAGATVRLQDLVSPIDKVKRYKELDDLIKKIEQDTIDPIKRKQKVDDLLHEFGENINKELIDVGIQKNQALAKYIKSGSRGTAVQYRQTVFSPFVVQDHKGRPLTDFIIRNSFAEGLTLPEYLASTFGARAGEVAKKLAVAKAGYLSKQLARASMTLIIEEHDCGTDNGVEVEVTDRDIFGTFLAKPAGGYNKNNEITPSVVGNLKNKGITSIIVRSPITCLSSRHFHSGAVCQLCIGKRERHGLSPIGDYIGLTAASTLGEPLAQGQLSLKHTSGSAGKKNVASGFGLIEQLASIPKSFKNKAPLAEHDGTVTNIRSAPQGGHYITIKS